MNLPDPGPFHLNLSIALEPRSDDELLEDLHELVAALERRVPRLERDGERGIARDAERLKTEAIRRIAELELGRNR